MPLPNKTLPCALLSALLLNACSTAEGPRLVPDTQPGDQLKPEFIVGEWCTNREETSSANLELGHSALTNVSKVFWRFDEDGEWKSSTSGFIYEGNGRWRLDGKDTLVLLGDGATPEEFRTQFKNDGADMFLMDEEDQALVLSACD